MLYANGIRYFLSSRYCTRKKWKRDDKNLDGLPIEYIIIKRVSEYVWVESGSKTSIDDFFILVLTH